MDFIEVYPNAIPEDLCDRLILAFENHSGVVDGQTGNGVDLEKKISRDLTLDNFIDLQPLKNELLSYTLKGTADYFTQYSMALMGAVAVSVSDEQGQAACRQRRQHDRARLHGSPVYPRQPLHSGRGCLCHQNTRRHARAYR